MKQTIKITDCERPIELPIENFEAHKEAVLHWCNGGDDMYDAIKEMAQEGQ